MDDPSAGASTSFDALGADPELRARWLAFLYLAGAGIGAISLILPHSSKADDVALWSNTGLAFVGGVVLLAVGRRLPSWAFHVGVAVGSLLILRAVLASNDSVSFYAVWFIWVGLYAFYFFPAAAAALHVAFASGLYAIALAVDPPGSSVARWLTLVATMVVAGAFIDTLVRRARRHARMAERSAASVATVAEVAHDLARMADSDAARAALCAAAARLTRADTAAIWEPSANGATLDLTGVDGPKPTQKSLAFVSAPAGAMRAFATGETVVGSFSDGLPEFSGDARPPRSCLWHPVKRDLVPIAVLALYWSKAHATDDPGTRTIADLLSAEVAVTLERVELLSRLESIARTDDLTGLPNRRAWEEQLPREVSRAKRSGQPLCVAMVDLDHFKVFNDDRGHQAGDRLLKEAAAEWTDELRGTDLLARYGGEEFALALPACPPDEALAVVERLRDATPEDQTCSAGIAHWDGEETAGALLGRADAALYEAKRTGRDRSVVV
jgi:diguanylate cyclase (GGDEF)-like protein